MLMKGVGAFLFIVIESSSTPQFHSTLTSSSHFHDLGLVGVGDGKGNFWSDFDVHYAKLGFPLLPGSRVLNGYTYIEYTVE